MHIPCATLKLALFTLKYNSGLLPTFSIPVRILRNYFSHYRSAEVAFVFCMLKLSNGKKKVHFGRKLQETYTSMHTLRKI